MFRVHASGVAGDTPGYGLVRVGKEFAEGKHRVNVMGTAVGRDGPQSPAEFAISRSGPYTSIMSAARGPMIWTPKRRSSLRMPVWGTEPEQESLVHSPWH